MCDMRTIEYERGVYRDIARPRTYLVLRADEIDILFDMISDHCSNMTRMTWEVAYAGSPMYMRETFSSVRLS